MNHWRIQVHLQIAVTPMMPLELVVVSMDVEIGQDLSDERLNLAVELSHDLKAQDGERRGVSRDP